VGQTAAQAVDLTGVDPARWPEIRRRVAILDEYVKLHRPKRAVRENFAARIGLSESQLMHLARAWRIARDASAIPGARSRISSRKPRRICAGSVEIAQKVIDELGPLARRKDVLAEVGSRCRRAGSATPSDSTIANMITAARAAMDGPLGVEPEILIDECTIKLPVIVGGVVMMPRVLFAIALPERSILAAKISFDATPPSPAALMATLKRGSSPCGKPLPIRAPHLTRHWRAAIGAISLDAGRGRPTLGRLLGNRLGELEVIHQAGKARRGEALAAGRHASALEPKDAAIAIADAMAAHNGRVPLLPASGYALETPSSERG
jgi:hypothetical protein